jgi:glutamate:GABA antiporter
VWLVCGIGILGCVASFILGFIPPSQLKTGNHLTYVGLLVLAVVVLTAPPFVIQLFGRRSRRQLQRGAATVAAEA